MLNRTGPEFAAEYRIQVFAPPDKVWDWLSRVDLWASWRQDVSSAYWVTGEGLGGILKWRLRKLLGFTATVAAWREEREMTWHAASYGSRISYRLRIDGDYKSTVVQLGVSGSGGILNFPLTRPLVASQLNRSHEIWLGALKTKLEAGKDDYSTPPPSRNNPFVNNVKRS